MGRLRTDRGLAVLVAIFTLLVTIAIVLATIALNRTAELARPSDQEVVDRLKRGVRVMSPRDARQIIGAMERKAAGR
jgi:voltage-gated potassium channel Kch